MVCAVFARSLVLCIECCVVGELFEGISNVVIGVQCSGVPGVMCWGVFVVFVVTC